MPATTAPRNEGTRHMQSESPTAATASAASSSGVGRQRRRQSSNQGSSRRRPRCPPQVQIPSVDVLSKDVNAPKYIRTYYQHVLNLMGFVNNTTYPLDKLFTKVELWTVSPDHIYTWMALKANGKPDPITADNPAFCKKTSMEFAKKAVSYFMETSVGWTEKLGDNPTKARKINRLI